MIIGYIVKDKNTGLFRTPRPNTWNTLDKVNLYRSIDSAMRSVGDSTETLGFIEFKKRPDYRWWTFKGKKYAYTVPAHLEIIPLEVEV